MNRTSEVRGHMGEMLFVVAGTYPDLLGFILEVVQNAIDANPKFISVDVDMETRTVVVQDDGSGVTQNTFERALQQIGITIKKKDRLGRFGRGVISPLGKCKSFTFTSCPRRGATKRGYLEWTFVSDDIREHPENVRIPMRKRKDLGFSSKPKIARGTTYVQWRTQVAVQDITKDSFVSRINMGTLADSILDKFGTVMRRHKIAVHVTYTTESGKSESRDLASKEYEGKALPKEVISHPDSGDTVFNLFLARVTKKGRRGKVRFGEMGDDFRLTMHQVSNSVRGVVGDDVLKALGSGIFEGDILSENVRLHPGRRSFEKNDALLGFLESLETWYKQVGSKHEDQVREQQQETRYQALGVRSMKVIEQMLKLPDWADILERFKVGNIGTGHTDLPPSGTQKKKTLSTRGKPLTSKESTGKRTDEDRSTPEAEKTGHNPMSVQGPHGQRRTFVRSGSVGLQFAYEEMPSAQSAYEFDSTRGVLVFNTRHRYWFDCEERDLSLMRYTETVAIMALALSRFEGTEMYEAQKHVMDEALNLFVFSIMHGDVLSGRQKGKFTKAI